MNAVAFGVIAFMLTAYVLLDGYDLGIAALMPFVARTDRERRATMDAIGPFWNGNEVWLIAAGGALFALFPQAYASAFSGFYLPLMVVLWLLMGRGIALELRGHFPSALWHQFWDAVFSLSSVLLILLFGIALGNLIRGVPLDANGYFVGTFGFLLNPFALFVGASGVVALALHGAAFLAWRIEGPPAERARRLIGPLQILARAHDGAPFVATSTLLVGLMAVAVATTFPFVIPAFPRGTGGLSINAAAPSATALASALAVTIVGVIAVCVYSAVVWKKIAGKVRVEE